MTYRWRSNVIVLTSLHGTWTKSVTCRLNWKRPPRRNRRSKKRYRTVHVEPPAANFPHFILIRPSDCCCLSPSMAIQFALETAGIKWQLKAEQRNRSLACLKDGNTWGYQLAFCTGPKHGHLSQGSILTVVLVAVPMSATFFYLDVWKKRNGFQSEPSVRIEPDDRLCTLDHLAVLC